MSCYHLTTRGTCAGTYLEYHTYSGGGGGEERVRNHHSQRTVAHSVFIMVYRRPGEVLTFIMREDKRGSIFVCLIWCLDYHKYLDWNLSTILPANSHMISEFFLSVLVYLGTYVRLRTITHDLRVLACSCVFR